MKKILVLTATLGNRHTLAKTIESVRKIGGHHIKHIIVAPRNTIPALKTIYEDIEFLPEPADAKGIYAALNWGFEKYGRNYDYLTFINDDDYWLPGFRELIDLTRNNYDFIYGKVVYVIERDCKMKRMACSGYFKDFVPLLFNHIILLTQQSTLIKSDLFFRMGGFSEKYQLVSDTKFWAELSLRKIRYKYIPKVCAAYTLQEGQLSSNKKKQKIETDDLLSSLPKPSIWKLFFATVRYRTVNIPTYFLRYLNK